MKKLFVALILFFLIAHVFALEINDISQISDQIQTGNQQVIKSNAELTAQINSLKTGMRNLEVSVQNFEAKAMLKEDLPGMYNKVSELNTASHIQILISVLIVVICSFAVGFLAKSKGWL